MQWLEERIFSSRFFTALAVILASGFTVALLASPKPKLAALPALGLIFLLGLWIFPQAGYYLIVFLIPFDFLRKLSSSSQSATVSKFVGIWVLVVVFMSMIIHKRKDLKARSNLWPVMLAFIAVSLISALLSEYRHAAFDEMRRLTLIYIFFGLTLVIASSKQSFIRTLPYIIIGSMSLCSFLSILGSVFHLTIFAHYGMDRGPDGLLRASGGSSDPNLMSAMALFAIPLIAHQMAMAQTRQMRLLNLGLLVINLYAIILTYSRSGALLSVVIIGLLLFEYGKRLRARHLGLFMITGTVAVILGAIFIPSTFWERQRTLTDSTDGSLTRRSSYVRFGFEIFKESPILGAGPGTYQQLYGHSRYAFYYGEDEEESRFRSAHNSYLETLTGGGLLGFFCLAAILLRTFHNYKSAWRNFARQGEEKISSLCRSYFYSFLVISLYLFFISALYHKYFWIAVAISQIALTLSLESESESDAVTQGRVAAP